MIIAFSNLLSMSSSWTDRYWIHNLSRTFMDLQENSKKRSIRLEELSDRLISLEDGASLLRISKGTLYNWLSSGRHGLRRVKVSGRTHLDRLQIEALLEKSLKG